MYSYGRHDPLTNYLDPDWLAEKEQEAMRDVEPEAANADSGRDPDQSEKSNANPSLDDLIPDVESLAHADQSEILTYQVESNNKDYEAPVLVSYGDDEESSVEPPVGPDAVKLPYKDIGKLFQDRIKDALQIGFQFVKNLARTVARQPDPNPLGIEDLPDKVFVDHRASKCLAGARDQGRCGSCYIFAAISMIEFEHCMRTGELVEFSEQFPLDCGARSKMNGCNGGSVQQVVNFVSKYGLEISLQRANGRVPVLTGNACREDGLLEEQQSHLEICLALQLRERADQESGDGCNVCK